MPLLFYGLKEMTIHMGSLLVCGDCGASYMRRIERGKVIWRCASHIEKGRASCESSPILEEERLKIQDIMMKKN